VAALLAGIVDRYVITLLFTFLGYLNAQAWPFLLPFVAFGAAIDIWFVQPRATEAYELKPYQLLTDDEKRLVDARYKKLLPLAIGCPALGMAFLLTTTVLEHKSPQVLGAIGPTIYDLTSPFIALLRNHHQDLLARGFPDRAHLVAVNYGGLYLLFYIGLGFWLGKIRNAGVLNDLHLDHSKRPKLAYIFCFVLFIVLLLFALHIIVWVNIDYNDVRFGRRRLNLNVAKYDQFFWGLALLQGLFGLSLPLFHGVLRTTSRVFVRARQRVPQG
jgi:hypothetical protein